MEIQNPECADPDGTTGRDRVIGSSGTRVAGAFASAGTTVRRPSGGLPRRAIGHIKELMGSSGATVDLCAGTGVLSGALWRAGCSLVAIEYRSDMLEHLRRSLPHLPVIRASPVGLPLRSASVEVAVYCAPFAGVSFDSLMGEVERIVDPSGLLILVDRSDAVGSPRLLPGTRLRETRSFMGEPGDLPVRISVHSWG